MLSLRSREQKEFEAALTAAAQGGLRRPKDLASARTFVEVSLEPERRHVVVYSAMRAAHDYEVRARRIRRALEDLQVLRRRAPQEPQRALVERATRILVQHKAAKYFSYAAAGGFTCWLRTAGLDLSITKALDHLEQLQAVEHTWEDHAVVVQATEPDALTTKILAALNIRLTDPVLRVTNRPAA